MRPAPTLIRAVGRWSLTATVINSVVGSSIFGMPSVIAGLLGPWSPVAVLIAGAGVFIIVLCYAEVGSRFEDAGGPYLYTRDAFGPTVGFHVGWLHLWTRLLSGAAVLNVFAAYLAILVPVVGTPVGRAVAMTGAISLATAINVIGVRQTALTVNLFTIAKLLPLAILGVVALPRMTQDVLATQAVVSPHWTEAILLLIFSYGGFESAVVGASEARDPRRDTAFALLVGATVVTVVYCLVQLAIVGVLPHAVTAHAPVASALGVVLGRGGAILGALAAVASTYGWLLSFAQMTPRILMAMATRHELPSLLAMIHSRFRTPAFAIVLNSVVGLGLGLYSSFAGAATLAAISRLGIFACCCAALIVLRRRQDRPAGFILPAGRAFAVLGVIFCAWLLTTRTLTQAWMLIALIAAGVVCSTVARKTARA